VNLTLAGNNLNGSIPDSLTTLPQLQLLDVSNNNLSGVIPNFSPKVKLNVTGNAFLVQNMSRQGGVVQTRNSSKAKPRPVIWIAGMVLYYYIFQIPRFVTFGHVQALLTIYSFSSQ
jgi:hypothetical protein